MCRVEKKPQLLGKNIIVLFLFARKSEILCRETLKKLYMQQTSTLRPKNVNSLILNFKKPHDVATTETISHWLKHTLYYRRENDRQVALTLNNSAEKNRPCVRE